MNWDRLSLVTPPAAPAVSLAEAKAHLRVDFNDDDAYITQCVSRAIAAIDGPNGVGRCLVTQSWLLALDRFPDIEFTLPLGPVQTITSVKYLDPGGVVQTLAPSSYWANLYRSPATICPGYGVMWPTYRSMPGSVTVEFVAGTPVASVPADLKAAVLLMVGHFYEHREAVVVADAIRVDELPLAVESILSRYRVGTVA